MIRPPDAPAAGSRHSTSPGGPGRPPGGFRFAGFTVRLTAGAYLLAMLAVVVSALTLPTLAPGLPAVAYLAATTGLVVGFLGSLIAHELAHAVTARRYGTDVSAISVGFFGGGSHARHEFRTPRALGRVAAAGPAASLTLAVISAGAALGLAALGAGRLPFVVLTALTWLNAMLTAINVLPGAGLDGGRVVHALAWARSGDRARAAVTAAKIGQFTGALLIAGGVALLALGYLDGIWAGLVGLVMVSASRAQAREVLTITGLAGLTVRDVLPLGSPVTVPGWQTVQAFLDSGFAGGAASAHPGAGGPSAPTAGAEAAGHQPGFAATWRTAFPVRDFDGKADGLLTLGQLSSVPAARRDTLRVTDVATPLREVVTTTPQEPMTDLIGRLGIRPASPAALHTTGHALVLADDGTALGVLTPADFARASQLGPLHPGRPGA